MEAFPIFSMPAVALGALMPVGVLGSTMVRGWWGPRVVGIDDGASLEVRFQLDGCRHHLR